MMLGMLDLGRRRGLKLVALPLGRGLADWRRVFDGALDELHYAGRCQRVGRCMRLLIIENGDWVGGVVLGSTFPNVGVRDEAIGLKPYVRDHQLRGLRSPWARENIDYWGRLQHIVNHARTFVFPECQGRGVGIRAHKQLLREGVALWEARYGPVAAFDTLCTNEDSGLFRRNGWNHVGRTKGYGSDRSTLLVDETETSSPVNNVALRPTGVRWDVWIRVLRAEVLALDAAPVGRPPARTRNDSERRRTNH